MLRVRASSVFRGCPCRAVAPTRVVRCQAGADGGGQDSPEWARPVVLPSGAMWLLNSLQDRYYSVRGGDFVIQRAEQVDAAAPRPSRMSSRPLPAAPPPITPLDAMAAIQQALWSNPESLMHISDAPVIDIPEDCVTVLQEEPEASAYAGRRSDVTSLVWVPPMQPQQLGIIAVPSDDPVETDCLEDVYVTNTTSPRRTKMVRFKCMADGCGAINLKPMNPLAFTQGTALACCAKCDTWHLVRDHLGLFNQLKGRVYLDASPIGLDDVPESLRPPADGGLNGGLSGGWAMPDHGMLE